MHRALKELMLCKGYGDAGIKMTTHGGGSDLSPLTGTVFGPAGTPYEGGTFELDIRVPCKSSSSCFFFADSMPFKSC